MRGEETGWRFARLARRRFRAPVAGHRRCTALVFVGAGGFIYYNTNILNIYRSGKRRPTPPRRA